MGLFGAIGNYYRHQPTAQNKQRVKTITQVTNERLRSKLKECLDSDLFLYRVSESYRDCITTEIEMAELDCGMNHCNFVLDDDVKQMIERYDEVLEKINRAEAVTDEADSTLWTLLTDSSFCELYSTPGAAGVESRNRVNSIIKEAERCCEEVGDFFVLDISLQEILNQLNAGLSRKETVNLIEESREDSFDELDGWEFELFCAKVLKGNGYTDVELTSGSGDQGIDIIAHRDDVKYGIQCKCYSSDVGNKAVQEAYAGKAYYSCHVAIVLTNRHFTHSAVELAKSNGVVLWDRDKLLQMIETSKE